MLQCINLKLAQNGSGATECESPLLRAKRTLPNVDDERFCGPADLTVTTFSVRQIQVSHGESVLPFHLARPFRRGPFGLTAEPLGVRAFPD